MGKIHLGCCVLFYRQNSLLAASSPVTEVLNENGVSGDISANIPLFPAEEHDEGISSPSKSSFQESLPNDFSLAQQEDVSENSKGIYQQDKRFIHGLTDKRFINGLVNKRFLKGIVNKRFINGLVDKRFINGLVNKRFSNGLVDKRFIHGLVGDKRFINGLTEKRNHPQNTNIDFREENGKSYMDGSRDDSESDFNTWQNDGYDDEVSDGYDFEPDMDQSDMDSELEDEFDTEKRFMRGLVPQKRFLRGLVADKRFMRGLVADKRFMLGLLPDKRFMRGLVADKRFMRGLVPDKRFMHGLVPDKRFMRGLVPDKRFMRGLVPDKRFMRGLVANKRFMHGLVPEKRFMDGLVSNDKRFMRGLVSDKRFIQGLMPSEKRFINGLVPHKRFMKGLVKRSVDNSPDTDMSELDQSFPKRFMHGLVRKSEIPVDKKFMRGLVRKSEMPVDKKFMRGLVRKSEMPVDKKFMRGLVRKSDDDHQLIPNIKSNFVPDFLRNNVGDESGYFRFDDGLDNLGGEGFRKRDDEDAQEFDRHGKRFMHGLVKKESTGQIEGEQKSSIDFAKESLENPQVGQLGDQDNSSGFEKKFMKGLVKKETKNEADGKGKSKKFIMGVVKKEDKLRNEEEIDKKFITGLVENDKKSDESIDTALKNDKRFLKGLVKKENVNEELVNSQKSLLEGITKESSPEASKSTTDQNQAISISGHYRMKRSTPFGDTHSDLMGTWYDRPLLQSSSVAVPEKKFIRGLIRRDDVFQHSYRDRSEKPAQKRFIQGLVRRFDNDIMQADAIDRGMDVDKRFIRGLIPGEPLSNNVPEYYRKRWRPTYRSNNQGQKRFTPGLADNDAISDHFEQPGKRFILGLVEKSYPSWPSPAKQNSQARGRNGYQTRSFHR
ncbi:Fam-a protein [Elysia marginata]|uniref:Fam-a protein n=1 Tax=Elysia marginata TaxID=1093978 RepID=A0AAV4EWJ7_9GAST|nr:Fam-a protein [Elysia marginata]